jgi:hypothetical protein
MIVCEFCLHQTPDGDCRLGLKIPKAMSCREFTPSIENFCADRADFVNQKQIIEMATYFGFHRTELKKIQIMAANEEGRLLIAC